ncbi:MAG TPA: helix-turn-helix transcriptional regulator [Candidatus Baltobacteraceae bacterium]|nr:helix-turn-helix transcriptional regulator [Candidatus Baltobacteraceae bacterium]
METFGQRLRRLRTERGLTIGVLAKLVGVTDSAIRQLESGESKSASFAVGLRLAHVLEVDPAVLAFGEGSSLVGRLRDVERRLSAIEAAGFFGAGGDDSMLGGPAQFRDAAGRVGLPPEQ